MMYGRWRCCDMDMFDACAVQCDDHLGLREEIVKYRVSDAFIESCVAKLNAGKPDQRKQDEDDEDEFQDFLSQNPSVLAEHERQLEEARRIQKAESTEEHTSELQSLMHISY